MPFSLGRKEEDCVSKYPIGTLAPNLIEYPLGGIMFMLAQRKDFVHNLDLVREGRLSQLVPAASFRTIS